MNELFTNDPNPDETDIAKKLQSVADQTQATPYFISELEAQLKERHKPKAARFLAWRDLTPTLGWVALVMVVSVLMIWSIRSLIPTPQPGNDNTPVAPPATTFTPEPNVLPNESTPPVNQEGSYDFRNAKLILEQPLPESPQTAHVYVSSKDEPSNQEQARALATQFGIQGEMYTTPGYIYNTNDYLITDGKRSLQVHSDQQFTYTADMENNHGAYPKPANPDAERTIREFLTAHGFDFPFQVFASEFFVGYIVQPLAPDSIPMQYESFTSPMMRVALDENGQVLVIDASLINYDSNALGEYGIITAQEAFDRLLDDSIMTGKMEFTHSPTSTMKEWYRTYPDNQSVAVHGYINIYPSMETGKPPLYFINGVSLIGNITGMEVLENNNFIGVTGQYTLENGIRRFNVESWDRKVNEAWISGMLSRQGDQVFITSDDGSGTQYLLMDPPEDLPIGSQTPDSGLGISGVVVNDTLSWYYIQFFESNSGGGGGGGNGFGFYKLNLSGVPVPFPSPKPQPEAGDPNQVTGIYTIQEGDTLTSIAERFNTTIDTLMQINSLTDSSIYIGQPLRVPAPEPQEQKVQDLRGFLSISLHSNGDGTSSKAYALDAVQENGSTVYPMEGPLLSELADGHNGLPILITGTINTKGKLIVDGYKIPYPDLRFQILKGTQRAQQLDGQTVIIFTTEAGQSYVEFLATNQIPVDPSFTGIEGDLIEQEVLIIPDETFGGMPVAHIYQSAIIQENGPEMEVQANRIYVYNDSNDPDAPPEFTQPDLTINKVELVYYVSNPYYQINDPNYDQRSKHLQPAWHFHGVYADGREFDVIIQALKQEFLLPELAPNAGMG